MTVSRTIAFFFSRICAIYFAKIRSHLFGVLGPRNTLRYRPDITVDHTASVSTEQIYNYRK